MGFLDSLKKLFSGGGAENADAPAENQAAPAEPASEAPAEPATEEAPASDVPKME